MLKIEREGDVVSDLGFGIIMTFLAAVIGFGFWWTQHKIETREANRDKARLASEAKNAAFNSRLLENSLASLAVGKATAEAVRDQRCNGNVKHAIEIVDAALHKTESFLICQTSEYQNKNT